MKKNFIFLLTIIVLLSVFIHEKKVIITMDNKEYYTSASEAGFESEAFYRCILNTLGEDRTSATDEELAQITDVICRSSNIESVKGIEKLTALRYLNLYDNKVSSMDFSFWCPKPSSVLNSSG